MASKVNCNFGVAFAQITDWNVLKAVANDIAAQLKVAYDERLKQLKKANETASVNIEVTATDEKAETKQTVKKAAPKAKAVKVAKVVKLNETEPTAKATKTAKTAKASGDEISITDTKAIAKLGLKFESYNEKCWVLRGDTKPLRTVLKDQFKGVFNSRLKGGEGWVIRTANVEECAKALGMKVKVS